MRSTKKKEEMIEVEPENIRQDDFLLTRIFNWIGDQFAKMVGGIVHFIPRFFRAIFTWLISAKLRNLIKAVLRTIMWMCIWIVVVFGLYFVFDMDRVLMLLTTVATYLQRNFAWLIKIVKMNAKEIWMTLALIGSLYGLVYGTVKWWRRKKAAKKAAQVENENENAQAGGEV